MMSDQPERKPDPLRESVELYANLYGEAAREEAEESGIAVPPELDAACRAMFAPKPKRKGRRGVVSKLLVAAIIATLLISMASGTISADGYYIPGGVAVQWNDDDLWFVVDDSIPPLEPTGNYTPGLFIKRLPEGYRLECQGGGSSLLCGGRHFAYNDGQGHRISLTVEEYADMNSVSFAMLKSPGAPKVYETADGRTFYLFRNASYYCAAWSDGRRTLEIATNTSWSVILHMIENVEVIP